MGLLGILVFVWFEWERLLPLYPHMGLGKGGGEPSLMKTPCPTWPMGVCVAWWVTAVGSIAPAAPSVGHPTPLLEFRKESVWACGLQL